MTLTSPDTLAQRRTFETDDVFFSVTDPKGVITHANATFLRLAHLTAEEAVGSPHNVVRHPDMPGGIFRLVWDELEAGRPVCSYMANQALDGARYDVLATFTPIDGGFLSVRLRPGISDLELATFGVYDAAATREAELRASGLGRAAAAEQGAERLLEKLGELGFGSLAELTRHVLPREIDAMLVAAPPAEVGRAAAGPLGSVLVAAQTTGRLAGAFAARLGAFEQLAERILDEREAIAPAVAELVGLRDEIARVGEILAAVVAAEEGRAGAELGDLGDLTDVTARLAGWTQEAVTGLDALPAEMEKLQVALRDLAMRVSMFVLLSHMITRFTGEVIASGLERGTELRVLHSALDHGLAAVEVEADIVKELLVEIPRLVEADVRNVDRVKLRVDTWAERLTAERAAGRFDGAGAGAGDDVATLLGSINLRIKRRLQVLDGIVAMSSRLRQTPVRFDTSEVREELGHIGAGVAALA